MNWEKYRQGGSDVARAFRADRAQMRAEGGTEAELQKRIAAKRDDYLRKMAEQAHQRLRGEPGYSVRDVGPIQDRIVDICRTQPKALPAVRIGWAFDEEFVKSVELRTPGSKEDRAQLPGTFGDRTHAFVGGGYCDVFTCDKRTAGAIAETRRTLGFKPPFAPGGYTGGTSKYVADLMAEVP